MNVIVVNDNKDLFEKLDIDIIKRIDGCYELDELLNQFVNLYYNKMILDITAIENYQDESVLIELASKINPERVIVVLPSSSSSLSDYYLHLLVKNGFYNFTRNFEGIKYLIERPNSLENVKKYLNIEEPKKEEIETIDPSEMAQASMINNIEEIPAIDEEQTTSNISGRKIIGIMNLTDHAGATSLTNMIVRQIISQGQKAIGIEMMRQDFITFRNEYLYSCMNSMDIDRIIKNISNDTIVIMDLNDFSEGKKYCSEILYLIEPSLLRLGRLMKKNRNVFLEHKNDKIILNMSFVSNSEVKDFEGETKSKVFMNIPPLNDRNRNLEPINDLISRLGI